MRLALVLAVIALMQCLGFGLGARVAERQWENYFAVADARNTAMKAYVDLRKSVIGESTALKDLIATKDKEISAAIAAERASAMFPPDGDVPLFLSGVSLVAMLVALSLLVIARVRRFGELTKADRVIRWSGVVLWCVLMCGCWVLFCSARFGSAFVCTTGFRRCGPERGGFMGRRVRW